MKPTESGSASDIHFVRCTGTSMLPMFQHGSIVIVDSRIRTYRSGSVVYVRRRGESFVHRIIAVDTKRKRLLLKGDNSRSEDGWFSPDNITGLVICVICHNRKIFVNKAPIRLTGWILIRMSILSEKHPVINAIYTGLIRRRKIHRFIHFISGL